MKNKSGFTIIEIIIAVAVLGTLAALVIVGYSGYQKRTSIAALKATLSSAASAMDLASLQGAMPVELPSTVTTPDNISLSLTVDQQNYYDNLSKVQKGVLLAQICADLIDEGYGRGVNRGGNTENYITGCGNWNNGSMQVTGWTSKVFSTPLSSTTLTDYADTVPPSDNWHPEQQSVTANFYRLLHSRFLKQGGSYPIESFWDYWANDSNGGVKHQALPSSPTQISTYCIDGNHHQYPDDVWHIVKDSDPKEGTC